MGLLERKHRDYRVPDTKNPFLTPAPNARRGSMPTSEVDYAMRLTDRQGNVYDHAGRPLPKETMPVFSMPHGAEVTGEMVQERKGSLQYVSNEPKKRNVPTLPNTPDSENKGGFMYKFYKTLKDRRENPQSKGKFAIDFSLETLGYPLVLIPGMQWLLALVPFIPWIETYTTGDILNMGEALVGKTLGGKKLTLFERGLYLAGGLLPIVPGRALVGGWEKLENELVYPALRNHFEGKQPAKK